MANLNNCKVKIKTQDILNRGKYSKKYTDFIKKNKNTIFTAKLDVDKGCTMMYKLLEDTSVPTWLFWENDLELVE